MMPADDAREIERVLVVVAHPDDVDFGAAGTVASWTRVGIDVSYCIVTDGAAGGRDGPITLNALAELRRVEQTAAAKAVGVTDVEFLDYPDGRVEVSLGLRRDLSRVIRRVRPQRVVAPSSARNFERIYASHPDHLAVGEATLGAVYPDARNPFAHTELLEREGLEPWTVLEVWLMAHPEINHHVDITDTFEAKMAALRSHESQLEDPDQTEAGMREWGRGVAEQAGLAPGRLAEGFYVIDTA